MSDSSEDEDLSRFEEVIDTSFIKSLEDSRRNSRLLKDKLNPKSERYLEESGHYNDVKVPEEIQKRIGAKISAILNKDIEFVDLQLNGIKKRKIKGGVKLFKDSPGFLSCKEAIDTYTETHNRNAKFEKQRTKKTECERIDEDEKIKAVAMDGDYILSKEETKLWKSRRKEKLFKYIGNKQSKVFTAVE